VGRLQILKFCEGANGNAKQSNYRDISLLTNDELAITKEINKMVDEIVKLTKGGE
jgi:hypothetical protein